MSETTCIETEYGDFHNCNNCGAYALAVEDIKHHKGCRKGESKYWQDFYTKANQEETNGNTG